MVRKRRAAPAGGGATNPTPSVVYPPPASPEASQALRGVVLEENAKYAFIEDMNTHELKRLQVGEQVARGKVADVTLTDILYESNGKQTRVAIGNNLDGAPAPLTSSAVAGYPSSPSGPTTPGVGGPSGPSAPRPPGALSAIEELMRQRRMQQGGARQ
jgi:hypothetical protein